MNAERIENTGGADTREFRVGDRVRYSSALRNWNTLRRRTCTGTITRIYPAHSDRNEDGEYEVPEHAEVRVDRKPKWWSYPGTDLFAPATSELTLLSSSSTGSNP